MVEEAVKQKPITDEIATIEKDIDIFAGWLKRLENPDPVLRSEAAGKGFKLYDEVDRDPHAGSVLQQRILAVVGKEWEIIPAKSGRRLGRPASTPQEKVVADFVSSVLENCNFDQARLEILKAILYGFYTVEIIWTYKNKGTNAALVINKLIGKHPRRFSFTTSRELRLLTPQNMIDGEAVPERKFVIFTYGDSDNPFGKGIGQRLWWPVWFKKNGIKFWLVFLEKFGSPTPVGKYPPGTSPEQQKALMDAIEAIQTDTGVKIPDSMNLEFLEASRAGTVSYENLCEYMDRQISKAVLGQTATTEGTPGKLGNENAQADVKQEIVEADADLLDSCLNETLIRWIVDYNFPDVTEYPKIKTYAAAKPNLKEQSEIDKTVVSEIGLDVGEDYFYETYGIPKPVEGEKLVKPPQKVASDIPSAFREFQEDQPSEAELKIEKERQKFVDRYTGGVLLAEETIRRKALGDIVSMLAESGGLSEQEFIDQIYAILDEAFQGGYEKAEILKPIKDCYRFYRLANRHVWSAGEGPVKFVWNTMDDQTLAFLEKIDRFYLSKYVENDEMKSAVWSFLKEQYLEKGSGLFGRTNLETIKGFRDLFSDKIEALSDQQIQRICDTSICRTRNYANIEQLWEGKVVHAKVVAVLDSRTSAICKEMNGKLISVEALYKTITKEIAMSPEEYSDYLKNERVTVERAEKGTAAPPYHPSCRTRLVMVPEGQES